MKEPKKPVKGAKAKANAKKKRAAAKK